MSRSYEKSSAYRELTKVMQELKEMSWCFKTQTSPDLSINDNILNFYIEISRYTLVKEIDGKKQLINGWYKKHTKREIEKKTEELRVDINTLKRKINLINTKK